MTNTRNLVRIVPMIAIGFIITLSACIPQAPVCPTPQAATESPTIPAPQEITPTPTPDGCREPGTVQRIQMQSTLLNLDMNVSVYLPPCYDPLLEGGYPAAYLFHGQTFDDRMWLNLGAAELADTIILEGAEPFVMIFPNEEFFYRPVIGNKFPEAIMEELLPWAEEDFNLCQERECRAIGGISRGASWAMRIGLTNPRAFSRIGIHSLPSFLGGEGQVAEWVKVLPKGELPFVAMDSGRLDPEIKSAIAVEAVFNQLGLPHTWNLNEGRHDEEYWRAQVDEYIHWYAYGRR
ncbi:MAG: hypothetical protein FJZ98_01795 [Chloroflexi bacterium]|nr:hypothetical protein [Chloroflexota bacterium]